MHDMMHRYDLSIRRRDRHCRCALLLGACSKLTLAHYDQVKVGMAYEEVTALIGAPARCDEALGVRRCHWGTSSARPTSPSRAARSCWQRLRT